MTVSQLPQGQTRGHFSSELDSPVNQGGRRTVEVSAQLEEILTEIRTIKRLVTVAPSTTPIGPSAHNKPDGYFLRSEYSQIICLRCMRDVRKQSRGMYILYLNVRLPNHASADVGLELSLLLDNASLDDDRFIMDDASLDTPPFLGAVFVVLLGLILFLAWMKFVSVMCDGL